jgi:hypothetical protein
MPRSGERGCGSHRHCALAASQHSSRCDSVALLRAAALFCHGRGAQLQQAKSAKGESLRNTCVRSINGEVVEGGASLRVLRSNNLFVSPAARKAPAIGHPGGRSKQLAAPHRTRTSNQCGQRGRRGFPWMLRHSGNALRESATVRSAAAPHADDGWLKSRIRAALPTCAPAAATAF